MDKQKLTLSVDATLIEQIKIQAVRDKKTVSEITEEMYREYLRRSRTKK